jgi:pyruvate/2-oxoglutarate dehydrogenase complex dihydrolipoamide acyltransferase (E2) component
MRKWVIILVGLIFAFSASGLALAQEKAKPAAPAKAAEPAKAPEAAKPAEPAKPAEAAKPAVAKKEAPKPVMYRMGGVVKSLDTAGKKITIEQDRVKKERKVTLTVGKKAAKNLAGISVGDVVNVWVTGKTVTTLTKVY